MIRVDCHGIPAATFATTGQFETARDCFVTHGYAVLDHVAPEKKIRALYREFGERYPRYLRDRATADSLELGGRRYMTTVEFCGGFANPLIFANPYVLVLVRELLGEDAILEAYGAVVSLSGSKEQRLHRDAPPLFNSDIASILPAHALTFALPLIDMNDSHGTTAIIPGSHRWPECKDGVEPACPEIPVGSCLLWDFRLFHRGTANRSEEHRPMIYATYARRWYQDPINFTNRAQRRLLMTRRFIGDLPQGMQKLFSHVGSGR